jgi:hypothetical protein
MTPRPRADRTRGGQEGFTLIELTVSLVAGLIVALGIVGMSRDATHTFHEEMRSSAAEANLRTGIDRLRADLARAGYMSTGNILQDPLIARAPGASPIQNSMFLGIAGLASLTLYQGQSMATPLSAVQTTPLTPDRLRIAGNMTSTDQYEVSTIQPAAGSCGGQKIVLDGTSPSMYRVIGLGSAPAQELNNIFQPTTGGSGQFIVRIVDKTGFAQFVATCAVNPTGIDGAGTQPQPWIAIDPNTPIQLANQTGTVGGISGYGTGTLVNAVQIVEWQLMPATAEPAQYTASLSGTPLSPNTTDGTKYDLVRSYVDALTGQAIAATTEVVAEYAVDFTVAFSVDAGLSGLQPNIVIFPFGDTANVPQWAPDMVAKAPAPGTGAQRIRSVRVRLATRAAEADRTDNVLVTNAAVGDTSMYRYCLLPAGCPAVNPNNAPNFARVRTVTSEVAMVNQARSY